MEHVEAGEPGAHDHDVDVAVERLVRPAFVGVHVDRGDGLSHGRRIQVDSAAGIPEARW
jgi:hypothetical protein